jgi:histone acetyltransferase (RNA polymerase elongator complex component)
MKILPLFIPHLGCPFTCIYCEQHSITKTAEPDFTHFTRLIQQFCTRHHGIDKEIAYFGGTFTALPAAQQKHLFSLVFPWLDATTHIRFSTRPDCLDAATLTRCKSAGVRTIELGIQSFSDTVLQASCRGYTAAQAVAGCQQVLDAGFDLGIQLMPGLPGDGAVHQAQTLKTTLEIQPHYLRIYPTLVLANTALAKIYETGNYTPLSLEEAIALCAEWQDAAEARGITVIKTGLHADIDNEQILAGPFHPGFGELVTIERLFQRITAAYQPEHTLCLSPTARQLLFSYQRQLLKRLLASFAISSLPVFVDPDYTLLQVRFQKKKPGENLQ